MGLDTRSRFGNPFAARENVQDDNTHHAGDQVARCGNREAEAAPAGKPECLIGGAHIVRLTGALPIAHGQQQSCRLEEAGHQRVAQRERDHKAGDALNQIGADDQSAGFEPGPVSAAAIPRGRHAQTHGNKAQRDPVIDQNLHDLIVGRDDAGVLEDQQEKAGQNSHGHQALPDKAELLTQKIGKQDGASDQTELNDDVP